MWHEARRQERKIRGMLVDYRRRAERRRDFYEKIKADPTQFLQIHGRRCKIHLDPVIAAAADSAVMMPWQGQADNLIDRFDVRAHLDYIPPIKKEDPPSPTQEDRQLNYERYRIIAQNAYLGVSEEKFLKQLYLEEQFGYTENKNKKEPKGVGVAIGFNYEDGTAIQTAPVVDSPEENSDGDNSDSDLDVDLAINVSKIDSAQAHEMNKHGQHFGMSGNDFYSFLTNDLEEAESYKLAKEEEQEKSLFSGRKSRRERRAHREKRLANRKISPPSYAAKESPTNPSLRDYSQSPSRTPSPDAGKITYITSFGDDEEPSTASKPTYAEKVKFGKSKKTDTSTENVVNLDRKSNRSRSRETLYNRKRRSESKPRTLRRSRSKSRPRRSRSRSRRRSSSRNRRSRSRSKSKRPRRSFSRDRLRRRVSSKSRSRSRSVRRRSSSRSRFRISRSRSAHSRSRSRVRRSRSRLSRSRSRRGSGSKRRSRSYSRITISSSSLSSSSVSSKSYRRSRSRSSRSTKSRSRTPQAPTPPKILPRYYGRKRSDESSSHSSSSDSDSNQDVEMRPVYPEASDSKYGTSKNSGSVSKKPTTTLTIIERLKRRRQAAINKQFIKDKIAEVQKIEREKQEQQTREDELREMAIKLRRRQREKRHAYDRSSSSDSDKSSGSRNRDSRSSHSRDRDSNRSDRDRRDKDRSRSRERRRRSRSRSREKDKDRRSRSESKTRRERDRNRDRDNDQREPKKLVDY
ncbi:CLK4-associating serine/arginine rich protein [Sitophilus oryzae]|uniref:CLK4-associating serine/arginine rich protein n=1 Tax=Sitophilus oryzae TaxID=7048 RepID=A0A6J2XPU8_SITOR|nr:CLK4-associating serine/arginine rich protein [Sitophilus oryzae]